MMKVNNSHSPPPRKDPNISDTWNIYSNYAKKLNNVFNHRAMYPKDADGMVNSVDPDRTTPLGTV